MTQEINVKYTAMWGTVSELNGCCFSQVLSGARTDHSPLNLTDQSFPQPLYQSYLNPASVFRSLSCYR